MGPATVLALSLALALAGLLAAIYLGAGGPAPAAETFRGGGSHGGAHGGAHGGRPGGRPSRPHGGNYGGNYGGNAYSPYSLYGGGGWPVWAPAGGPACWACAEACARADPFAVGPYCAGCVARCGFE